jgi:hypothetical protein
MRALLFCLLLFLSTAVQAAGPPYWVVADGQSLKDGLDIFDEMGTRTRQLTTEEFVRSAIAANYVAAFVSACYIWQTELPNQAPFELPPHLNAEESAKVVLRYLKSHPDLLHEEPRLLVFDAIVAAYPRKK